MRAFRMFPSCTRSYDRSVQYSASRPNGVSAGENLAEGADEMSSRMDPISVPGTLDALSPIRNYVKAVAEEAGLERAAVYNLILAVDEIATNVVEHGYQEAGRSGDISVGATSGDNTLEIRLADTGKSFDPTAQPEYSAIQLSKPLEEYPIGGLGIMLAKHGVDELRYEATENGNICRFIVRLKPSVKPIQSAASEAILDERRKLQILLKISRSLSQQIELDPLLKLMVTEVNAAMEAERTNLLLVDHENPNELVTRVAEGVGALEIRIPFGVGIAGVSAQTRQIINVPEPYKDSRFNSAVDKESGYLTTSLLASPIIADDGQLMGVIEVMNKDGGAFTAEDERFLEAIGSHLSVALRRAEMVEAYGRGQVLMKSLELARDIQMGLVPKDFPALPEFNEVDIYATMIPALEVGGDLYDFFPLDRDRICFVIGDVSDKGIPAALFMSMTRTAFKISATSSSQPISSTMSRLNRFLWESNRSQMFVTALAGVLDLRTGVVEYADAGHEPPFIRRSTGTVQKVDKVGGTALGVFPDPVFRTGTVQLQPGDALFLYTDGVNEARNVISQFFGTDDIARSLAMVGPQAHSQGIVARLLDDLRGFVGESEQSDDITMLVVRYLGRGDASGV